MYLIWQLSPRRMLCGYRETKAEADNFIIQLQAKQKNAIFEARKQPEGENK